MKKRIIAIILLILLVASFAMPAPVSALTLERTKVEVISSDGTVAKTWEFQKPADALTQVNDVLGGSVSGLPDESERTVKLTLGDDWKHDSQITFSKPVTIDLNGHAVVRTRNGKKTDNGSVFKVSSGGVLTIEDSNPMSPGFDGVAGGVIAGGASKNCGGGIHVGGGGKLVMNGGTIYNCSSSEHGGGVMADKKAEVYLNGVRIYSCKTDDSGDDCHGGGVFVEDDAYAEIYDCTIENCYSEDNGGAVFINRGTLILKNDVFKNNRAKDNGGGVAIWHETKNVRIEDCTFTANRAGEDGGGLHVNDNIKGYKPIIVSGCVFTDNYAGDKGGGIYIDAHGVVLLDSTVTDNTSKNEGGGVWVDSEHDINVGGVLVIRDNKSEKKPDRQNLCLQRSKDSILGINYDTHQAYIFDGGLLPGSDIRVSSTSSGKIKIAKEDSFTTHQFQYLTPEKGTLTMDPTKEISSPLIGTIAGSGSLTLIGAILIALCLIAAAGALFAMRRKQNGGNFDETED